ncbi:MAG: glycosyltransferase family 2 protein [Phycisphaerae bacterium]
MMRLSIIAPCYNEADNIAELRRQLEAVARQLTAQSEYAIDDLEFVFVDDGSRDATLDKLKAWAHEDPRVRVVALSRNFGHQAALSAGIDHATGDAVVVMDADLQHPPELILEFVRKWRAGYDLVYAYREGVRPRLGYRFINSLMKIHVPAEAADFRLMARPMVSAFRRMPEHARFIRGMISWLGFRQIGVGYTDRDRFAGERAFTVRQTAQMALNAVLSFSNLPLRVASLAGLVTILCGCSYAAFILYHYLFGDASRIQPGWTALIMTVLILGGVQLLCLGIIAEYIGRIFEEVKQRPLYVVRELIGKPRDRSDGE